ncbi:hypothetical protein [Nocardia wallacei]|uniref:hypothetical protein n=1 Tax=Nocardia wallacei TaxID=480035 RepID=UPI002458A32C|nr:hypothetical protein [Nocardia wallacei]
MLITAAVIALVTLVRRWRSAPGAGRRRLLPRARALWQSVRRWVDGAPRGLAAGAGAIALMGTALLMVPCAL